MPLGLSQFHVRFMISILLDIHFWNSMIISFLDRNGLRTQFLFNTKLSLYLYFQFFFPENVIYDDSSPFLSHFE
jgi:hypothetical protein